MYSRLNFLKILLFVQATNACFSKGFAPSHPTTKDVTTSVFKSDQNSDIFPAAYGDFNGDKLTDIITLDKNRTTVTVFLGSTGQPYMTPGASWNFTEKSKTPTDVPKIDSVTMGDFTGDGLMDLMITTSYIKKQTLFNQTLTCNRTLLNGTVVYSNDSKIDVSYFLLTTNVSFCIGDGKSIDCNQRKKTSSQQYLGHLIQEPIALDLNGDMILDLFGEHWESYPNHDKVHYHNHTKHQCNYTGEYNFYKIKAVWLSEEGKPGETYEPAVFKFNGTKAKVSNSSHQFPLAHPSASSFADFNQDSIPDLALVTENNILSQSQHYVQEVYRLAHPLDCKGKPTLSLEKAIPFQNQSIEVFDVLGQPIFIDFERNGNLMQLFPYCNAWDCSSGWGLMGRRNTEDNYHKLMLGPIIHDGELWKFVAPLKSYDKEIHTHYEVHGSNNTEIPTFFNLNDVDWVENFYARSLTLQAGDYNLDGYPDLIAVLQSRSYSSTKKAVIFENVPCTQSQYCPFSRTFSANFELLNDYENITSASFFDLQDNGVLDVILVQETTTMNVNRTRVKKSYKIRAIEMSPNVDSYFMKVTVLSGRDCPKCWERDISYGNIFRGALFQYKMTDVMGNVQTAIASQGYRSGYTNLDLPFTIFGIGHSSTFVNDLRITVGYYEDTSNVTFTHDHHQIIPNSQITVIAPYPLKQSGWTVKLFLTLGGTVLESFGVFVAMCVLIGVITFGLEYWERRNDRTGRSAEAQPFLM